MIVSQCFPKASKVIDRFHVQKLAFDAVQEIRIKHLWEALDRENHAIEAAKQVGLPCQPECLLMVIHLNNCWSGVDICYLSIRRNGQLRRSSIHDCFSSAIQ